MGCSNDDLGFKSITPTINGDGRKKSCFLKRHCFSRCYFTMADENKDDKDSDFHPGNIEASLIQNK